MGNEQDYHFKVLFIILKKLGFSWASELFHLSYGMVDLPSGKMKSREGTVVDADDQMDEVVTEARTAGEQLSKLDDFSEEERTKLFEMIGLAALKYCLLKVDPKKRMLFDPAASIDLQGHTGPFIQYTYARIRSLLRKSGADPVTSSAVEKRQEQMATGPLLPEERNVLKLLHQFPAVLNEASLRLDPSSVANHAYELVKAYNGFYQAVPVLKEEDARKHDFRLTLSGVVAAATKRAMWCLGIDVPECGCDPESAFTSAFRHQNFGQGTALNFLLGSLGNSLADGAEDAAGKTRDSLLFCLKKMASGIGYTVLE